MSCLTAYSEAWLRLAKTRSLTFASIHLRTSLSMVMLVPLRANGGTPNFVEIIKGLFLYFSEGESR